MAPIVPRMNPTQARAWIALVSTAELLPAALDAQLTRDAGLINFEYGILSLLVAADGRALRAGELAEQLRASAPRLSKAVSRLQKRGLVRRAPCPEDGRAINIQLTREGQRAWLKATPPHVALARDTLLADLTDDDLAQLSDLLSIVLASIDDASGIDAVRTAPADRAPKDS